MRCTICDHEEGFANDYLHLPGPGSGSRKQSSKKPSYVYFRKKYNDWLCSNCVREIENTYKPEHKKETAESLGISHLLPKSKVPKY